jgi:hypothetical protein
MEQQASEKQDVGRRGYYPLTLDAETAGEVDKLAEEREWSKSKTASRLIEIGLETLKKQPKAKAA